jgi:hypothetical protein
MRETKTKNNIIKTISNPQSSLYNLTIYVFVFNFLISIFLI